MTEQCSKYIDKIAENFFHSNIDYCGPGLLSGKSGISLFLFYYSRLSNKQEYANKAANIVENIFKSVYLGFNFPTFCDGIFGYVWVIEHLIQNDFIDRNDFPFLDDLDVIIYQQMIQQVKASNWDFMHGSLGGGIYFLERLHRKQNIAYLEEFLLNLEKQSTKDGVFVKWMSNTKDGKIGCDLGLAHGVGSVIVFLSKLTTIKQISTRANELLNGTIKYLLEQELPKKENRLDFPNYTFEGNLPPEIDGRKVGWCYGDLSRATSLYQAGKANSNSDLCNLAIKMLNESTEHRDLEKEEIKNPWLCHGTTGIAHIYNRIYIQTNDLKFKLSSDYWFNQTFIMTDFINAIENFNVWNSNQHQENEYGILGLSGVGLSLISKIAPSEVNWDRCLLLS